MIAFPLSLLAAAAPAATPAGLECRLVTPAGDPVTFTADFSSGAGPAFVSPAGGTSWPSRRLAGAGGLKLEKGSLEGGFFIAGRPGGVALELRGERATLFGTRGTRNGLPVAHGFCVPAVATGGDGPVSPQADAAIPAFDRRRWPEDCALITRDGRRGRIDYKILDMGARIQITPIDTPLLAEPVVVRRSQGGGGRSRFAGEGAAGVERLATDATAAVQLIDFERLGSAPAAAICGHSVIVKRPHLQ